MMDSETYIQHITQNHIGMDETTLHIARQWCRAAWGQAVQSEICKRSAMQSALEKIKNHDWYGDDRSVMKAADVANQMQEWATAALPEQAAGEVRYLCPCGQKEIVEKPERAAMSDRRQHYFRCPVCHCRLKVGTVLHPQAKADWSGVDWSESTKTIARRIGVTETTVSKKRARLAPNTLRAPRTRREGA
jgi:hypothetical protein